MGRPRGPPPELERERYAPVHCTCTRICGSKNRMGKNAHSAMLALILVSQRHEPKTRHTCQGALNSAAVSIRCAHPCPRDGVSGDSGRAEREPWMKSVSSTDDLLIERVMFQTL
jgi:hypothetical protein